MSISINSSGYSNAVNVYSSNQKAGNAKPTLEQLQEIVSNSKMDTFTLTPIDVIPDSNVTDGIPISDRPAPEMKTVTLVNHANNDVVIKWDVIEGADIRNVQDNTDLYRADSTRDIYYSELFNNGIEYANTVLSRGIYNADMTSWIESNRALLDTGIGTVEGCTVRYSQLREEVIKTFDYDRDLLAKNLQSLDKAFELSLKNVARNAIADIEPPIYTSANTGLPQKTPNKLAEAKGYNQQELFAHTQDMMSKFALNFINQIRSGIGQAAAYNNTLSLMNNVFAVTTSVNKLSFNDFALLGKYMLMDVGGRNYTAAGNIAQQNMRTEAFNNSTELSAELRALL